jgi:acyl carrier protein
MANPLPNEKELYGRIESEGIAMPAEIWDLLYNHIGDDVTAINFICKYHLESQLPIPVSQAQKILHHTHHIKDIVNKTTVTSKEGLDFPEFIDDMPLHPILREMLTHYIGNDIYVITLIAGDAVDPLAPEPLSLENCEKILGRTRSISDFMERLRSATTREKPPAKPPKPAGSKSGLSREAILQRIRGALSQEFKVGESAIQPSCRFREDLGFDSIDGLRVVMVLEDEFGLEIPDDAPDKILTVSQAVDYIFKETSRL